MSNEEETEKDTDEAIPEAVPESVRVVLNEMAAGEISPAQPNRFFPADLLHRAFGMKGPHK